MIFKTIYLLKYLYISRYSFKNQIYFCAAFQFLCTWTFGRQLGRQKMALNSIIGWILFYLDRDLSSMKLMLKPNLANIRSEKSWVSHFFSLNWWITCFCLRAKPQWGKFITKWHTWNYYFNIIEIEYQRAMEKFGITCNRICTNHSRLWKSVNTIFLLFKNRQKKFLKLANKHFIYFTLL